MSIDFPREEERILARWKEIDAFLRQVELVRLSQQALWERHEGYTRSASPDELQSADEYA